ncbi:MAG: glycerol-3-phosphate dehydrogenase/oxidase [Candidatus Binatia bacterium]
MKRDLRALTEGVADLVVIGGGIYGTTIAREAALRGLDVRLVESGDFGAATSANSHHIIHGGIRYWQHGDLGRVLESVRERHVLSRIAPHLVRPLPAVIPTYGHGLRGREVLTLGIAVHRALELATGHRDRVSVPDFSPGPLSRRRIVELLPGLPEHDLTGGVLVYDSQVTNSERLLLAIVRSAVEAGARAANYVEALAFLRDGGRVAGVSARDRIGEETLEIRARTVINAAGPWLSTVAHLHGGARTAQPLRFARALNLVTREVIPRVAAGLYGKLAHHDSAELVSRGRRFLFLVPWRGRTILGTAYKPHEGDSAAGAIRRRDVGALLDEINAAYPAAKLAVEDVALVHTGLLPAAGSSAKTGEPEIDKHYRIVDHSAEGAPGLLSVVGVKYTTARDVAARVVDAAFRSWGKRPPRSTSAERVLPGGEIGDDFETYRAAEISRNDGFDRAAIDRLVGNYGSRTAEVLRHVEPGRTDVSALLAAEVRHGVREEMALTLSDLVFRRTDVGSAGHPGRETLAAVARLAAGELGWSPERTAEEIAATEARYRIPD